MQKSYRFVVSVLLLGAFLLSACSGAALPQDNSNQNPGSGQDTQVVFTGTVQSMGGGEWNISGQAVGVAGTTAIDANIQVGDIVKVEATVSADGKVLAVRIEASLPDDPGANANGNGNENANSNANANSNENMNGDDNGNDNANANANGNGNDNGAPSGPEQEIVGAVQAMTKDTITIGGVTYKLANFTEFKTPIVVGDQVKIHMIVNADGSLTIREIEKTTGTGVTTNNNGNDDNGNASNSNDDNSNSNSNSNDDNSNGDDNSNDDNSNDDNDNDSNSNG
jgi:hypothetical protein